jgi:hypothetical protein
MSSLAPIRVYTLSNKLIRAEVAGTYDPSWAITTSVPTILERRRRRRRSHGQAPPA